MGNFVLKTPAYNGYKRVYIVSLPNNNCFCANNETKQEKKECKVLLETLDYTRLQRIKLHEKANIIIFHKSTCHCYCHVLSYTERQHTILKLYTYYIHFREFDLGNKLISEKVHQKL